MTNKLLIVFIVLFFTACQAPETKVWRVDEQDMSLLMQGARKPLVVNENTKLIDSRSAFDYTIMHLKNAVNLHWTEFADHRGPKPGKLKEDYFFMARRLARLGIDPSSKVIIVGYGHGGKAEEARLAWTLYYLGVKDVQFAKQNYFKARLIQGNPKIKVKKLWKPKPNKNVRVTTDQMKKLLKRFPKNVRFLDVRHPKEYRRTQKFLKLPRVAINVYWQEFISASGRPNLKLKSKLLGLGFKQKNKIIVLSDAGIVSSAAVMSLLSMGFKGAANFDGGWVELSKLIN